MSLSFSQVKQMIKDKVQEYQQQHQSTQKSGDQDILQSLQKSVVLHESKCFNESSPNFRQCRTLLSKLIYLINQGETFTDTEGQNLFFSVTKLFSHDNMDLRRMIYLMIKEFHLDNSMYIVTASLIKDISSKQDLFRLNSLRTIPLVLDPSNLVSVERLIKTALIDKNYAISSAALLSGIKLYQTSADVIVKWQNEVIDRLNSKYVHNHFHAIILLHEIKKNDKNSFTKVISKCIKENFKEMASIQLIRFVKEVLQSQELDESTEETMINYLNRQAHKSNESVIFEACKALCELKHLSNKDLAGVVSVLSMFFQSLVSVNRFMTLKILNKLISNPTRRSLITSTEEIEFLLADPNKSISSLAVSILLKLCKESNIDNLLTQIYDNLSDMSDEFKIDILKSIKSLVKSVPKRSKTVLQFLSNCLKSEGTYEFKKAAIEIIEMMVNDIPDVKEQALTQLAEYIEDCQYQYLQLQVLSILNREASRKAAPTKIIRFVNNRIHLEEPQIRAASVGIIGKFGQQYPQLKSSMVNLLRQTQNDPDEEVRERGFFHIQCLEDNEHQVENQKLMKDLSVINLDELDKIEKYVESNLNVFQDSQDQEILDIQKIDNFAQENKELFKKDNIEVQQQKYFEEEEEQYQEEDQATKKNKEQAQLKIQETFTKYSELFSQHEIFSEFGDLRKISDQIQLSEKDSEYEVYLYKFFFDNHIVLEYQVKNTVTDRNLKDVKMEVIFDSENIKEQCLVPATFIGPEETSNILIGMAVNPEERICISKAQNILQFTIEELDHNGKVTSSYEDDYQIEDFSITASEYLSKLPLEKGKFNIYWEGLKQEAIQKTYLLHYQNTDFTVKEIIKHFGISVCDGTDQVKIPNKPHLLQLAGVFLNTQKVLIQIMTAYDSARGGCPLKISVKSGDEDLSESIANCIQQ